MSPSRKSSSVADILALADSFVGEGISAFGLSGQTDGGRSGPAGGGPPAAYDQARRPVQVGAAELRPRRFLLRSVVRDPKVESDVLAFSGSGPITFVDPQATAPWDRVRMKRRRVSEDVGYFIGQPTDATQTGYIQIEILDSTNLRVHAPGRVLEKIEAYKLFEQFQIMFPRSPMLNTTLMENVSSWWKNFALEGDLLEIDCTNGYSKVTNVYTGNFYALGCLGGSQPTYQNV